MTRDEFQRWLDRLEVIQPSLPRWLEENCSDQTATLSLWFEVLERYRFDECLLVIDHWGRGIYPAPKAYERDQLHLHVKASIDLKRDRDRKQQESQNRIRTYVALADTPTMSDSNFLECYWMLHDVDQKHRRGEISEIEYVKEKHRIIDMVQ